MWYVLILIINYLIGSIPSAYLIGRYFKRIDIRDYGSGNIGATNAFRVMGTWPGTVVFVLDMLKGVAAILLANAVSGQWFILPAALAVMIGHNYPVFLRFKGGRGVATGAGIILALSPQVVLLAFILFVIIVLITKYVSLASIIASASVPILMFVFNETPPVLILGITAAALVIYRHKGNIQRLMNGTEHKIMNKKKNER